MLSSLASAFEFAHSRQYAQVAQISIQSWVAPNVPASCLVESLIKQFNQRVKGSEKFWSRPDHAEAILQVRAALLSDDDRLTRHTSAPAPDGRSVDARRTPTTPNETQRPLWTPRQVAVIDRC